MTLILEEPVKQLLESHALDSVLIFVFIVCIFHEGAKVHRGEAASGQRILHAAGFAS